MLRKYTEITFRRFLRFKKYTLINLGGLSVGLAVSMFILLWVVDELRVDKFHFEGDQIYRVFNNYSRSDGSVITGYNTQGPLAEAIANEIPEAHQAIRMSRYYDSFFQYKKISFYESGYYADAAFFEMFTFPVVSGNSADPILDKNSVAISQSMAHKLFNQENPIGKILKVDKIHDLKVTAVFTDPSDHSSLQFDYIMSFELLADKSPWLKQWNDNSIVTYVKLKEGANIDVFNQKLNSIFKKNCSVCKNESFVFPFENLHLYGQFENGKPSGGRIEYVKLFSIAAFFIIIMACANFTNLATAQASTRWREIGVRKVIGAQRKSLIRQFIGESVLLSVVSFFVAILIVESSLPFFNQLTEKKISLLEDPSVLASFTIITLLTGILAGIYPAFYLSAIKPVRALRGTGMLGGNLTGLRKSLVIFQFALSSILTVGSFTVYNQITFIRTKSLGFEKENILLFELREEARSNVNAFRTQAKQIPGVESIGLANHRPFRVTRFWNDVSWPGKPADDEISFDVMSCDEGFIPTLKMQIVQGRNFTALDRPDASNYLINEKAAEVMGLKNPVGAPLITGSGEGRIIGVVKNFHHTNLRNSIAPLIITFNPDNRFVFARVNSLAMESAIEQLRALHKVHDPESPFEYQFLNESFDQEYKNEDLMGTLSFSFAAIAIFISFIGLFGLVSFTTDRRSKEICIRKLMGASVSTIVVLLSKDFIRIVVIALAMSFPLAFYVIDQWLQDFAYHINISWKVFAIAGTGATLIASVTISLQAINAALTNPVDSLRNE